MDERDEAVAGEAVRAFLAERDEPCPTCGYNLRGLGGTSCPECGLGLRLGVMSAEPRQGALLATLAGIFAAVGAAGFVLGLLVFLAAGFGMWAPGRLWVLPAVLAVVGAPLGGVLGSRGGRVWFRRRGPRWRVALACLTWLIAAGSFVGAMALLVSTL